MRSSGEAIAVSFPAHQLCLTCPPAVFASLLLSVASLKLKYIIKYTKFMKFFQEHDSNEQTEARQCRMVPCEHLSSLLIGVY